MRDENLLYQSILKYLLTEIKSNIYFPWYGRTLTPFTLGKNEMLEPIGAFEKRT